MNKISFQVIIEKEEKFPKNNEETWNIRIDTYIDQKIIDENYYPLDLIELIRSKDLNGGFFIFTCTCGIPECGGILNPIVVKHVNNLITWNTNKLKFIGISDLKVKFLDEQYSQAIYELINDFIDNYELLEGYNYQIQIVPALFDKNLVNDLKKYLKTIEEKELKEELYKFLNYNYEIIEFKEWTEQNNKLEDIFGIKLFKELRNLTYEEYDSAKQLKKFLKSKLPESLISEVKEINKAKIIHREYFVHPYHEY